MNMIIGCQLQNQDIVGFNTSRYSMLGKWVEHAWTLPWLQSHFHEPTTTLGNVHHFGPSRHLQTPPAPRGKQAPTNGRPTPTPQTPVTGLLVWATADPVLNLPLAHEDFPVGVEEGLACHDIRYGERKTWCILHRARCSRNVCNLQILPTKRPRKRSLEVEQMYEKRKKKKKKTCPRMSAFVCGLPPPKKKNTT